jgi:precorrin-2/cobalt-factor-2 C20-methyltransferase
MLPTRRPTRKGDRKVRAPKFYGVGVGPGPQGLIPVAALEALREADVIYAPRAKKAVVSVARQCLSGLGLGDCKFKDVVFNMDPERSQIDAHYDSIAADIVDDLKAGKVVAYLTIGDSLTYSTYSYLLQALLKSIPDLTHKTFPGVTSFAAIAAALDWPLGQGKERLLILPCPDLADDLRHELMNHEVVVVMKIGSRLPMVLSVLKELNLEGQCCFGSRIGLPGELLSTELESLEGAEAPGYLMTMLIRCCPQEINTDSQVYSRSSSKEAVVR